MHITLYSCHAKPGRLDAIVDLYHEWQRLICSDDSAATELFSSVQDAEDILMLARFGDESAAWAAAETPAYRSWYSQLVSLTETGPIVSHYLIR